MYFDSTTNVVLGRL